MSGYPDTPEKMAAWVEETAVAIAELESPELLTFAPPVCQCGAVLECRLLADVTVWAALRDWTGLALMTWVLGPAHDVHVQVPDAAPALVRGLCRKEATP